MTPPKTAAAAKNLSKPKAAGGALTPATVVVPQVSVIVPKRAEGQDNPVHMLRKQELIARIAQVSGAKNKDIKPVLDIVLTLLGDALCAGEELNLPPLGKMKVNRQKTEGGVEVLILKLRRVAARRGGVKDAKQGLAEADEDD